MTSPRTSHQEQIEKQAALWSARMTTGSMSNADRLALAEWLEADPEHRYLLTRYRELCGQLDEQLPVLLDSDETDDFIAQTARRNRRARRVRSSMAIAAVLAIASALWWLQPQTIDTVVAQRSSTTLADGSHVDLNARTSLRINLGRRERRVRLVQGEAFFSVAHDASRPFFVETDQGEVRVTGTRFNVHQSATAGVEVTVLEGAVQVQPLDARVEPVPLRPDEQLLVAGSKVKVQPLTPTAVQNAVAWREGQVTFETATLAEVLEKFANYTGRSISVSAEAAGLHVGGRYSLDDVDGFLNAIQQALPVNVLRGHDGSVRVVARSR